MHNGNASWTPKEQSNSHFVLHSVFGKFIEYGCDVNVPSICCLKEGVWRLVPNLIQSVKINISLYYNRLTKPKTTHCSPLLPPVTSPPAQPRSPPQPCISIQWHYFCFFFLVAVGFLKPDPIILVYASTFPALVHLYLRMLHTLGPSWSSNVQFSTDSAHGNVI